MSTGSNGAEVVARVEQFGMKLAHQFPWTPASAVAVGLALRRRFLGDPDAVSKLTRRKQIMAVRPMRAWMLQHSTLLGGLRPGRPHGHVLGAVAGVRGAGLHLHIRCAAGHCVHVVRSPP